LEKAKIIRMGYSIQAFLVKEGINSAKPKVLTPWLIEQGYFSKDHRNGLPLRNLLRELDEQKKLYLLPNLRVERKEVNRLWKFIRIVD